MRKLFVLFLSLNSILVFGQNPEKIVFPELASVKLFTTGAQLLYHSEIDLQNGTTCLKIKKLPTRLDERSFTISFNDSSVNILSVVAKVNTEEEIDAQKEIVDLMDSLRYIDTRISTLQNTIQIYKNEQQLLYEIIKNNSKSGVNADIDKSVNYFHDKNMEISNKILEVEKKIKSADNARNIVLSRMKDEKEKQAKLLSEIVIMVSSKKTTKCHFTFKYIVNAAGWKPNYDFKVDYNTKKMEIIQKAEVFNNTGIDWNEIPLVLSTARPDKLTEIPELEPMDFGRDAYIRDDLKLEEKTKINRNNSYDTTYRYETMKVPEFVLEYQIKSKYKIPSDAKAYSVDMEYYKTETKLWYVAVPKMDENVFLTALVPNWKDLNLLDGEANVYLNGALVTKTEIRNEDQDTFKISLGTVNNVRVSRNKIKGDSEKAIVGTKVKYSFAFEIVVQNFNEFPVDIQIIDQVPVSTDRSVDVEIINISNAKMANNGLLTWKCTINAKERQVRNFSYSIKYPEGSDISKKRRDLIIPCPAY